MIAFILPLVVLTLPKPPVVKQPPAPQGIIAVCKAEYDENESIRVPLCQAINPWTYECQDYVWPVLKVTSCTDIK